MHRVITRETRFVRGTRALTALRLLSFLCASYKFSIGFYVAGLYNVRRTPEYLRYTWCPKNTYAILIAGEKIGNCFNNDNFISASD